MKQHTLNKRLNILSDINLGQLLESSKPTTLTGDKLKTFLVENHNNQKFNSISGMLNVASNCLSSKDVSLINIGHTIIEAVSSNLDARLIYCLESAISNKYFEQNSLLVQLSEKLDELLIIESIDEKSTLLRSGVLSPYKTASNIVDWIHEAVQLKQTSVNETVEHKAYNPIIFIDENASSIFFRLANKVFAINENGLVETVSPNPKFAYLSSIVESLKYEHVSESFIYVDKKLGAFKINEQGIYRNDEQLVETYEQTKFIKEMGVLVESLSNSQSELATNRSTIDAMLSVKENFSHLAFADNILMIEHLRLNEKYAIIINENKSYVATLASLRYPTNLKQFNRIDEALDFVKKRTNYDASEFFTASLNEQSNHDEKSKLIADKYNDLIEELDAKKIDIKNRIVEHKKNLQFNKAKALESTLVIVESAIIEQKQNFSKQMFS